MNAVMTRALADELAKIASNLVVRPASIPSPPRTAPGDVTKPQTGKMQTFSNINTTAPMAAQDTASGSKAIPPPPVRT